MTVLQARVAIVALHLTDLLLDLETFLTRRRRVGRHRLTGRVKPFDRADYEWGTAIKAMAARMESRYRVWQ